MIKATNWSYICIVQLSMNARMETLSLLLIVLSVLITGSTEPVEKKEARQKGRKSNMKEWKKIVEQLPPVVGGDAHGPMVKLSLSYFMYQCFQMSSNSCSLSGCVDQRDTATQRLHRLAGELGRSLLFVLEGSGLLLFVVSLLPWFLWHPHLHKRLN